MSMGKMLLLPLLIILSSFSMVSAGYETGYPKFYHSVKKLQKTNCPKSDRVRRGDEVTIKLSASVTTAMGDTYSSEGAAEKQFIVGRHEIVPLNQGVVGMCAGDVRRVRIRVEQSPGAVSDPVDYIVTMVSRDHVGRVKAYVEAAPRTAQTVKTDDAEPISEAEEGNANSEEGGSIKNNGDGNHNNNNNDDDNNDNKNKNGDSDKSKDTASLRVDGKGEVLSV
mmetsp:Transcript_92696/g.202893  ORF Transcript_92696/g.202893 Transcript_92696/m.202893 type:complete len:223 (-) Transcript_92696:86-754(-)